MKANNILETIGNTPHVRINTLYPKGYEVWLKLESRRQHQGPDCTCHDKRCRTKGNNKGRLSDH